MPEVIKIDRARKQIVFKQRVSFGKTKIVKAKLLYEVNYSKFDKDLTGFINYKGHTYVYENVPQEQEIDEIMDIKSKVVVDEDLARRYWAGASDQQRREINEVLNEYNISNFNQ